MDDSESTAAGRIRGAALAGSLVGAVMGGPVGAMAVGAATVATAAAFTTAKEREGGIGKAARSLEKAAGRTGNAIKRSPSFKAVKRASSFKLHDDSLEADVARHEAAMRSEQNNRMRRGTRVKKFAGSVCNQIKKVPKNLIGRNRQSDSQGSAKKSLEQNQVRALPASSPTESKSLPQRRPSWKLPGRRPSFKDRKQGEVTTTSVDAYVAKAGTNSRYAMNAQRENAMNKAAPNEIGKPLQDRSSIIYRIAQRVVEPYALSQDETRALAHHVSYQFLTTLNHSWLVQSVTGSTLGTGVKNNYITNKDLRLIVTHIAHEVETAVENNEVIQSNAIPQVEVVQLARSIVDQVMMCASNSATIQEHKLSAEEMQSLAGYMRNQAQAKAYDTIRLTSKELRSLARYLKFQARQAREDNTEEQKQEQKKIAKEMEEFIANMEEQSCCSSVCSYPSVASLPRRGRDESKEEYYDSEDYESTDCSGSESEDEGEWVDDYKDKGNTKRLQMYDFDSSLKRRSKSPNKKDFHRFEDESAASEMYSDYEDEDASCSSRYSSEFSYDSKGDFDCSRKSRHDRRDHENEKRKDRSQMLTNKEDLDPPDDSYSDYEESVCGNVEWTKEDQKEMNDSDDDFEDAADDFQDAAEATNKEGKEEEKSRNARLSALSKINPYQAMPDAEDASELALQILEKMLFS